MDIGIGTPYSGVLETNYYELNIHILGFRAGIVSNDDTFIENKLSNNHNNIYFTKSFQAYYVVPFGNFFEIGVFSTAQPFSESKINKYLTKDNIIRNADSTIKYQSYHGQLAEPLPR